MDKLYIKLGFIQGDGCLGRLKSKEHKGMEINIGKYDDELLSLFCVNREKEGERSFYLRGFNEICRQLGFSSEHLPNRPLPLSYDDWTELNKTSFLYGLYSANGCFIKNGRIAFKTTCEELSVQLKSELERLGYHPYITTNKPKNVTFENGTYKCKQSYDINIGRQLEVLKFYNEIGFIQQYKNEDIKEYLIKKGLI